MIHSSRADANKTAVMSDMQEFETLKYSSCTRTVKGAWDKVETAACGFLPRESSAGVLWHSFGSICFRDVSKLTRSTCNLNSRPGV